MQTVHEFSLTKITQVISGTLDCTRHTLLSLAAIGETLGSLFHIDLVDKVVKMSNCKLVQLNQ